MCELSQGICIAYLSVLSILDIRFRKMPVWLLVVGGIAGTGYQIWKWVKGDLVSIVLIGVGAIVGILFLGVSKITGQALGYGDGIIILILGICLGFWDLSIVLMIAFFIASVMAIALIVVKKGKKKRTMPFVPFLCIGYIVFVLMG